MRRTTKQKKRMLINSGLKPLFILSIFLLTGLSSTIFAQEFDISGTVKDEQGLPIPGATVVVKGENIGIITDENGFFTLHLTKESQIEISFVGFNTQTLYTKYGREFDVVLEAGNNELEEVVVIGYGEQKVKHATYSVANVSLNKIEDIPATNLGTLLRDQIPGVVVTGGDSRPGEMANISIRQSFSWSKDGGTSTPLIVIDDVPQVETNSGYSDISALNNLDVSEIESITVLKDAAAAIYGSRASQGAIVIKTKRGKAGKPRISYSGKFAFNDAISHSKTMNTYEYGLFANSFLRADGVTNEANLFSEEELEQMKSLNYNWLDEGWKPAHNYQHALNLSGGTDNVRYYTGGSYVTQTANMGEDNYTRWNFRSSINAKVASGLKLNITLSANKTNRIKPYTKTLSSLNDKSYGSKASGEPDYSYMLHMPKYIPWSYEIDGKEYFVSPALGPAQNSSTANTYRQIASWNYFAMIESSSLSTSEGGSYNANFSLQYDVPFIKGLMFKGTYAPSYENSQNEQIQALYSLIRSTNSNREGSHLYGENTTWSEPTEIDANESSRVLYIDTKNTSYQANAYIIYSRSLGLHEFGALASVERSESFKYEARQLYENPLEVYRGTSASAGTLNSENTIIWRWEAATMSYLGRMTYAYADKYLAQFIVRSDASTKFAPENYWGTFPSASFGWVPSLESFFADNINWIDFLKIRYSVGLTGKDNIKAWKWLQFYSWDGNKGYKFGQNGGLNSEGIKASASPNRSVHWDKSLKQNIGIDATVLDNRLSFTYEFWHDKNSEMLLSMANSVGMPISAGGAVAEENFGEVWSWGHEMSLSWRDKKGDFMYKVKTNFQFGYNNIVKKYYEQSPHYPASNETRQGSSTIFPDWGFKVWKETSTGDGILRTDEDIQNYWAYLTANAEEAGTAPSYFNISSVSGLRTGMLAYQDLGGVMIIDSITGNVYQEGPNGIIEEEQDYAKLVKRKDGYGFNTSIECAWKSLSLYVAINTSWGNYRQIDVIRQRNDDDYMLWNREPFWTDMYDEVNNPDGKYPNIAFEDIRHPSDFWQLPSFRSYIRTLTLAYTLPKKYCNMINLENIRFNLTGNNLWDFYNPYPGKYRNMYDASSVGYPTLRTWTLGINITF